ncbi:MAG: efflux RND transporter permease subunit [Armatimonadetes bacterium]|nr:efflux RND transporter permease subunit [Armatimonadota bacterium]
MIERIIDWSANNRALVILLFLLLSGAGVWGVVTTPVDAIPDLSEHQVIVFTEWMGRSPQIVEDQVTYPIATALQGLAHVKAVRANSMFGMSFIFVIFEDGTDLTQARARVQERLQVAQAKLPTGVTTTLGPDGTGVGHIFWYTVEGEGYDLATLRSIQDWFIRYRLAAVDGVAEVASIGGFVRQYQVDVDEEKMRSFGITFDAVVTAVQRSNNEVGGKLIEVSGAEFFVRGQGYLSGRQDLGRIPVATLPGGIPLRLDQVAAVQLGADLRRGSLEKDGKGEAVGGIVVMRQGENASQVIERVKAKIAELAPGLPKGVHIVGSYDRTPLIQEAIGTLERALIEEALIVTLVVLIFIFHVRSAVRILIEIPVSVLLAFLLMRAFGITSNIMSLGGIALAIGVVVDSSIVLVENAYRNIAEAQRTNPNLPPSEYVRLAILSAKQVGRAIFFSEAIMVLSFLPVFLLEGQEGKLFHPLAWTKTFVIAASAVVAITLVPVLMTLFMRGRFRLESENPVMRFFHRLYTPILGWCLRWRKTTIALNLLALAIAVPMVMDTGSEFMPTLDEDSILFMPVLLPNAAMPEVNRTMAAQDRIIAAYPEVSHVLGKAGRAETATDNAPLSMIETIVLLKPHDQWRPGITKQKIIEDLDRQLQIPGVRNGWTQPIINRINMLATGVRTELGLKIYGTNLDTLERLAIRAEEILKAIPGAADVAADRVQGGSFLDITLRDDQIARYGLRRADVQMLIETAIGGENIGQILDGRARYPVRVRYQRSARSTPEAMAEILIPVGMGTTVASSPAITSAEAAPQGGMGSSQASGMGGMGGGGGASSNTVSGSNSTGAFATASSFAPSTNYVRLGDIADIRLADGPAMISSENGQLRSVVFLNVRGRDMGGFVAEAKERLASQLKIGTGYSVEWSGQYENKQRAESRLMIVMPVVFLVIFLMLYMTMKDWKEAGVVMLSVPFALVGGIYLLHGLGYNLSVAVWVGFIALYGVAVQTGVVMVVYLHHALDAKLAAGGTVTAADLHAATMEGAVQRLRPKLMTVATSMLGLVPIMFADGAGSDVMKPLVTPMIGGLLTSAVHVLIMTPVLFIIMKERALRKGKLNKSQMAEWMG